MKIDYRIVAMWVLLSIIITCALIGASGCSAQYHLKKYQDKGGICGRIDTIKVVDSVLIYDEIRDTLRVHYYTKDSLVIVNDRVVPKTIREIRYEDRVRRDTLRMKEKEIRYEWKEKRNDYRKAWIWVIMAAMGLAAAGREAASARKSLGVLPVMRAPVLVQVSVTCRPCKLQCHLKSTA